MLTSIIASVLAFGALTYQPAPADDGHELTQLWKRYEVAEAGDQPVTQCKILAEIKEKAVAGHYIVDFYDAATKYVDVSLQRNWKLRDSLYTALKKEIADFGEPFLEYKRMNRYDYPSADELWNYASGKLDKIGMHRTPALWSGYLDSGLLEFVKDDGEYVLWEILGKKNVDYDYPDRYPVYVTLQNKLDGSYPLAPYLEYITAYRKFNPEKQKAALEEHMAKYDGKAIALFSRQALLKIEYGELQKKNNASSSDYEAIYEKAKAFEKARGKFKGDEAKVASSCTFAEGLIDTLTAKSLEVRTGQGKARIFFRNMDKATLEVTLFTGNKVLYSTEVKNPVKSFYVRDSVDVDIPAFEDGSYEFKVKGGKDVEDSTFYDQFRLSTAIQWDAAGQKIYVAEYNSGKPVPRVTLFLKKQGSVVATETLKLSGVFTLLPSKITRTLKNSPKTYFELVAETFDADGVAMRSNPVTISYYNKPEFETYDSDDERGMRANLYKDQGAYRPGDTLRFKTIVFKGSIEDKLSVIANRSIEVRLFDTEYKLVGQLKLKTNAFGSASGEFELPTDRRGGYFNLGVYTGKDGCIGSEHVRVDEYQLPTFSLSFDRRNELFLPGEDIPVSGKVTSYSGHPLTGATLSVIVKRYSTVVARLNPEMSVDGKFDFTFKAPDAGYYDVEVRVTDATGETLSFNTGRYVNVSFSISSVVNNRQEGYFELSEESAPVYRYIGRRNYFYGSRYIVEDDVIDFTASVKNTGGNTVPMTVFWSILNKKGDVLLSGSADSGKALSTDITSLEQGLYTLRFEASTKNYTSKTECRILKLDKGTKSLPEGIRYIMMPGKQELEGNEGIDFRLGTSDGEEWAVVSIYGKDLELLDTKQVNIKDGALDHVVMPYKSAYPDAVAMQVFFFKDGRQFCKTQNYARKYDRLSMPLEFTSFKDMTRPGTDYTFTLKTQAGVEALAAVYDKSIDAIRVNEWDVLVPPVFVAEAPYVNAHCGNVTDINYVVPIFYRVNHSTMTTAGGGILEDTYFMKAEAPLAAPMSIDGAVAEESVSVDEADAETADVAIRQTFSTSLTFQPHLLSDASGNLSFSFHTSDKLSTYYVAVYVHDKKMRNALVRKETIVTIPVKVALVQPQMLYGGDSYVLSATVSSISDEPVKGSLYLYTYPADNYDAEPLHITRVPIEVAPHDVIDHKFNVDVPEDVDALGFKLAFVADGFSDGLFVSVPVNAPAQTLTEAHSAVFHYGDNKADMIARLRGEFVNADGASAEVKEVSLLDMVKAAIPEKSDPACDDIMSLSEAWYVRVIAETIGADFSGAAISTAEILAKILACRNSDGGFAWFEGMNSSAILTAVVMERFASAAAHGIAVPDLTTSVKFLDDRQFVNTVEYWRGGLSDAQYMYVRSMYASVPFEVKAEGKEQKQLMKDFKKNAKAYLVPSGKRGLTGQILAKARRVRTLENLVASKEGIALAKAWGVSLSAKSKMEKSLRADVVSLLEYAVEHRDGGWYYPNAVMPWRGLLESEAYAHAMLCNLLSGYADTEGPKVADGIRIWLMLQKESQNWGSDSGFVEALAAIMSGSKEVLATSVIALSAEFTKPFKDIKASGNGFTIERHFYRLSETGSAMEEIQPGTVLNVGDKILAAYKVWNQENRSFIKLTAAREGCLRPEKQLSGHYGWWQVRCLGYGFGFTPQGYRHVKSAETVYYFDILPEENLTVEETFFVTQAGSFSAPVVSIESLYAPAYRANDAFRGPVVSAYK